MRCLWVTAADPEPRHNGQYVYSGGLIDSLAAAGSLMPGDIVSGAAGPLEATNDHALAWLSAGGHAAALIAVWLSGAVVAAAAVAWGHGRFSAALRAGRAGPAAVGLFQPKLVLPSDFAARIPRPSA